MKLKDKVAIITGGGAGIGKAIAKGYAREGADIVIGEVVADRLPAVKDEIEKIGRKCLALEVDICKRQDVDNMVKKTMDEFAKIDILVNNAAIYPATPFLDISEEEWLRVIDIDLNGIFRCTQAVAREMVKRKSGKIISVTSGQGLIGITLMSHYSAAKAGICGLTRALASELSPLGINVNAISPGLTATENVSAALPKQYQDDFAACTAQRRLGKAEDYVGIAVLLASEEGSFITAETICVDGGIVNVMAPISTGFGE